MVLEFAYLESLGYFKVFILESLGYFKVFILESLGYFITRQNFILMDLLALKVTGNDVKRRILLQ